MYSIFSSIITTNFFKEVCPVSGYLLRIFVHIINFVIGMFLIKTVELLAKYLYKNENCINFTGKVTFTLVKRITAFSWNFFIWNLSCILYICIFISSLGCFLSNCSDFR